MYIAIFVFIVYIKTFNKHLYSNTIMEPVRQLRTEDLGKEAEMAICQLYNTPYDGKYNYTMDAAESLKNRFVNLKNYFPDCIHTAKNGSMYDFTSNDDSKPQFLSAKTSKRDGKVCPQVIGQPTKKKYCEHFNLPSNSTNEDIKMFIQNNLPQLLKEYSDYTFHCPIIYYNKKKDMLKYITKKNNIDWEKHLILFGHIEKQKDWNESTTIYLQCNDNEKNITLGEFQIHNHRDGIKFRWKFENLIELFADNFEVVNL